jgi:hypothetical protein
LALSVSCAFGDGGFRSGPLVAYFCTVVFAGDFASGHSEL